jgi:hypothetical protein
MPPIDISNAWKSGARIINSSIALLPNFVLAIVIFALFLVLASASKSVATTSQPSGERAGPA